MSKAEQGKTFTVITRSPPYGSNRPQLSLDVALAAAVFEQPVNYVFLGDGLYQLLKDQNAEGINNKTLGNAMETLDLYGIDRVIVEAEALEARGLLAEDLLLAVRILSAAEIAEVIRQSDCVINL